MFGSLLIERATCTQAHSHLTVPPGHSVSASLLPFYLLISLVWPLHGQDTSDEQADSRPPLTDLLQRLQAAADVAFNAVRIDFFVFISDATFGIN